MREIIQDYLIFHMSLLLVLHQIESICAQKRIFTLLLHHVELFPNPFPVVYNNK